MKKIIAITAMAAMVAAAAMADEPAVDLSIAEFKGDASVTWGIDLDADATTGRTGFKNETSASIKLNIVNAGDKTTEGEGVWGEAKVKLDNAFVAKAESDGATMALADGKVVLDTAKLHIGDLYIGIKSGDTQVGKLELPNALKSSKYGVSDKGPNATQGLVVGYGNDTFGIDVDFRSLPEGTDYYTDQYAAAAQFELKDLAGLNVKAGASFGFDAADFGGTQLGLFGSVGYKLAMGDNNLKISAGVGYNGNKVGDSLKLQNGEAAASVLYAWGDEADENGGVYYLDNDEAKKRTPGVGVAVYVPLVKNTYIDIVPAFYSGEIVENLTASAIGEFEIPVGADWPDGTKIGMAFAGGVKYKLAVGDAITVTPQAGFRFASKDYAAGKIGSIFTKANTDNSGLTDVAADPDGLVNVKAGVEIGGLIPNTTFEAWYQSRNLVADTAKAGTFNIKAKISF